METGSERNSQTLGVPRESYERGGERIVRARRAKGFTRKPTDSTKLSSQGLTEAETTTRELASEKPRPSVQVLQLWDS